MSSSKGSPEILPWVGAGNPARKPNIRVVDLDLIEESDLFRLRLPPYPNVDELADSLRELGQTTPLFVRPKGEGFELIAGYRRRAALEHMRAPQAIVRIFEGIADLDAYALAVSENADRGDLTDWERAQACLKLQSQGRNQDQIAFMFKWKDSRQVRNLVRVARSAPPPVADALQSGRIQLTHALALTRLAESPFTSEDAVKWTSLAVDQQWSVKTIEKTIAEEIDRRSPSKSPAVVHDEDEGDDDGAPVRYRQFKSGTVHLSARIDPTKPETLDDIAEHLRKALRLISKHKRKQPDDGSKIEPEEHEATLIS